ncbi:MAG: hypothetical protein ABI852_01685 [Gemmatimonadaceae bacterium]
MMTVPSWLGSAVAGAILAFVGYVGKQIIEWRAKLRLEERVRRARLAELMAMIRAGDAAFSVQSENRDRLVDLIRTRDPALNSSTHSFDHLFTLAYSTMTTEERELHDVVRAITMYTFQPLNEGLLKWIQADAEFRVRVPGETPRGALAKYLADLEAHLYLWQAKYRTWIPDHPERALVYLADEERHGVGFPRGGVALVAAILHQQDRIGA